MFTATVTVDEPEKLAGAEEQSVVSGVAMQTTPCCARAGETQVGTEASTVNSSRGIMRSLLEIFKAKQEPFRSRFIVKSFGLAHLVLCGRASW